jgi:hypothetical protein
LGEDKRAAEGGRETQPDWQSLQEMGGEQCNWVEILTQ